MTRLDLDPEQLNACVACGLCLPFCPTFRVSGEEAMSPRGRIDAMRSVEAAETPLDDQFIGFMNTCVQCRACEPACPSGVNYGALIGDTRAALAERSPRRSRLLTSVLGVLSRPRVLGALSTGAAVGQRARLVPKRLLSKRVPLRRERPLRPTGGEHPDVWLFSGCVMDAWYRSVHHATATVLDALGVTWSTPQTGGACCGALHEHAGLRATAVEYARSVIGSMPGDAPILVNSAGCGAHLKHYGALLGTDGATRFAQRVFDVHEWIAPRADQLELVPLDRTVIVQDPCHLRNVQRAEAPMHELLRRVVHLVELDDDGMCCGAGGAYSILEPRLATAIRDRKVAAIDRARSTYPDAQVVASANPGCAGHLESPLRQRGVATTHPIELIAEAVR